MVSSALTVSITVPDLDRGRLEQLFEVLGEKLMERQGPDSPLLDHSVSIDLGTGVIEIAVTTTARSLREAEVLADYYIEDVLSSAGGVYSQAADAHLQGRGTAASAEFATAVNGRQLVAV